MSTTLLCAICVLLPIAIQAQQILNHDFEKSSSLNEADDPWMISWGNTQTCYIANSPEGRHLHIRGTASNAVGFVEQELALEPDDDYRLVEIQAFVKTIGVNGRGAGLNIGVYDASNQLIATRDMGGLYSVDWSVKTTDWLRQRLTIVIPAGAVMMKIGAILYGSGVAMFDEFEFQISSITGRRPSDLATQYIESMCDTISRHALVRDSVDINAIRQTALSIAGPAKNPSECYPAVRFLIDALRPAGDHHSFFMTTSEVKRWESADENEHTDFDYPICSLVDSFGIIWVPGFHSGIQDHIQAFADSLQRGIQKLDSEGIRGWIVDLRDNDGGNMEPMIAGLGPLLDEGVLGSLEDVNGNHEKWLYRDGTYFWEDESLTTVSQHYSIKDKRPIAVLTGPRTGSSGEIVVISFIGNARTRSFGATTWGLTTGNGGFDLNDGARLMLSSTIMCDRFGKRYHGPIEPDVLLEGKADKADDPVLDSALKWIKSR